MPTIINMTFVNKSTPSIIQRQLQSSLVQPRQYIPIINGNKNLNFMNLNTFKKTGSCKSCRGG